MDAIIDTLGNRRFSLGFALGVAAGIGLCVRAARLGPPPGRVSPPRGGSVTGARPVPPRGGSGTARGAEG